MTRMADQPTRLPQIMVVDDDAYTVAILAHHLQREGFVPVEAVSGAECIRRAHENPVDVILLDLMMPEMDGFEFLEEMRRKAEWRSIPVVVVTARDLTDEERNRLNDGVERIIQKKDRDSMLQEVRSVLVQCIERRRHAQSAEA